MTDFAEEIREFLIESNENLAGLDREIVLLEQAPENRELISSAFRTFHTLKGTCGFFGFEQLGAIAHVTENILSQAREGERVLTPELISLVLSAIDEIKSMLVRIEETGQEGQDQSGPLRELLEAAFRNSHTSGLTSCANSRLSETANPSSNAESDASAAGLDAKFVLPGIVPSELHDGQISLTARVEEEAQVVSERPAEFEGGGETAKDGQLADSTIRVDVALLNRLMNLVGELVLARNQLLQETSAQNATLQQTSQRLNLITSELQEGVMKTRMQPIGVIWNKLPRVVRDLASKCGKRVHIEMEGAGTELDKTIIEAIKDPITHIVRNSCDHGIEAPETRQGKGKNPEGRVRLRAYHEGGVVNIEITDDGAGIDPERVKAKAIEKGLLRLEAAAQMSPREAVQLIFMPGFSTAAQITSISGRGVGMDVVKTNIEKIGGTVEVLNRVGNGTTIRIKIPLTLAIIPGLVVTLRRSVSALESHSSWREEERFIIPQANLLELVRLEGEELFKRIASVHGTPVFHHRGKLLPLLYLSRMLDPEAAVVQQDEANIVVLQAEHRQLGLVVDRICDTQEIVVKPLGRQLKGLSCYVGATIMGDGRPALILDVVGIARIGGLTAQPRPATTVAPPSEEKNRPQALLLLRAGQSDRLAVPLSMVDRLEEVSTTQIERAGRQLVLRYRDDILPLVTLGGELRLEGATPKAVQIVVFSNGQKRIGLVVDQVIDIVNEIVSARRRSDALGLLGSAIVGGRVTDLLDLHAVVEMAGENWLDTASDSSTEVNRLLLLDTCPTTRQMMVDLLSTAGYEVLQSAGLSEAMPMLTHQEVHAVVLTSDVSAADKASLLRCLLRGGELSMPVVELADRPLSPEQGSFHKAAIRVLRQNRAAVLETIRRVLNSPAADMESLV